MKKFAITVLVAGLAGCADKDPTGLDGRRVQNAAVLEMPGGAGAGGVADQPVVAVQDALFRLLPALPASQDRESLREALARLEAAIAAGDAAGTRAARISAEAVMKQLDRVLADEHRPDADVLTFVLESLAAGAASPPPGKGKK